MKDLDGVILAVNRIYISELERRKVRTGKKSKINIIETKDEGKAEVE